MKKSKKIIILSLFLLTVAFFTYCFFPVLNYDPRLSQHVNMSPSESRAPGRILLTDRNGEVITDKMYPGGYYTWIDTSGCFASTQSQLPLNSDHSSLPLDEGELKESSLVEGGGGAGAKSEGVMNGVSSCEFINSLIQIEDKNYFFHWGVNLPAKLRAVRDNLAGKRVSGGSTITEQYVKNKYFSDVKRNYLQKAREAVLALYFSQVKSKEHILNMYYHDAYFGNQLYGVGAALEVYFGKDRLEDLTGEEIVILLSLLHNPGIESLEEEYFQDYFEQVKNRLGYEFERSYFGKLPRKENIDIFPFVTQRWLSGNMTPPPANAGIPLDEGEQKEASLGGGRCPKDGGSCDGVSIDSTLQSYSREILQNTLSELSGKNVTNGAIFALNPKTGETLIYQGSKDFYARDIDGQVDVIQSLRQPGSTMKPFLYLMALEQGAYPDDLLLDIESEYNSFKEGTVYISENYSLREYGLVRLKKALGNSFNNASVRLARELGLTQVYEYYKSYGFELARNAEYYGYSLVLGNPSIRLEQLVRSYAKLLPDMTPPPASAGIPLDEREQIKASLNEGGGGASAKTEGAVAKFLLYDILSDPDNRDVSFGVNSILNTSIPQAVKTGTSSDFRDNLVVSYHPDFVLGVWVGNNDNSSMQGVTGITGAGYIWHQVIEKAIELGYIHDVQIPVPEGVTISQYCLDRDCYRKENIYMYGKKEFQSRIADGLYRQEDIYESLSEYELQRLAELSLEVQ